MLTTPDHHPGWTIRPGTLSDYFALAPWHYRAGRPARVARVLAADGPDRAVIGVLVVAFPVLNAPWRALAWPGCYQPHARPRIAAPLPTSIPLTPATPARPEASAGLLPREAARRLNRDVRCIARVVVDPRWRGVGLGACLVRDYLRRPLTPRTEAVAAMGGVCPLFARAGMTAWPIPPSRESLRLRAGLDDLGVEPWRLCCPWALRLRLDAPAFAAVGRLVAAWAAAARSVRVRSLSRDELFARAAQACDHPRWAFTADATATR